MVFTVKQNGGKNTNPFAQPKSLPRGKSGPFSPAPAPEIVKNKSGLGKGKGKPKAGFTFGGAGRQHSNGG